tara:strand:- start:455 stop:1084 length:630 start_codon:yes stop_codon:yes gene_type:complete
MSNDEINFLRPFGPSIAKVKIPEDIISNLNQYIDEIILDEKKSLELDHGKNLAGNVKQEFIIEPEMLKSSGLANFLGKAVQKWIQEIEKKNITEFKIISSWVVRQFENEYNPIHYHDGHISGVGYLKIPESYGKPFQKIKNSNINGHLSLVHGSRMFNSSSIVNIEPKLGDFYLFPNYLMHCVYPFYGNDERRSISFNAYIDEKIYNVY